MDVKWTKEQLEVIYERDKNILVSAAAGSGKTAVLVERIIQRITAVNDPVGVDEIVVVTFTEAAAGEMKERIRLAIESRLKEEPDNFHLQEQAVLVMSAQISTIHGFCLRIIRDNFHEIDIDPSFRVAEEGELVLIRQDILDAILEKRYEEGETRFLQFIDAYGNKRGDDNVKAMIYSLYNYARSYPDMEGYLLLCEEMYQIKNGEEFNHSKVAKTILGDVKGGLKSVLAMLQQAVFISRLEEGPLPYEAFIEQEIEELSKILASESYKEIYEALKSYVPGRIPTVRNSKGKTYDMELKDAAKKLRDDAKDFIKELRETYFFQEPSEMVADIQVCNRHIQMILSIVREFDMQFAAYKKYNNIIDFSDMEHYALAILTRREGEEFLPSLVAKEYQKQYREIMIDEYQDSNLLQEVIFKSISRVEEGEYNLFMVGDIKQSIYRFRLARPDLFLKKYNRYAGNGEKERRIDLHKNFRSRDEVLSATNFIFERIMTPEIGGICYDTEAALKAGASYPKKEGMEVETCVLNVDKSSKKQEQIQLELRFIAARIKNLVTTETIYNSKDGTKRPVRYGDIVILLRNIKGIGEEMKRLLSDYGIPAYIASKVGYFSTREVSVLLDYLQVIDNGRQDIPLAAVLTSDFVGLSEEELATIKIYGNGIRFCDCVFAYAKGGENQVLKKKLVKLLKSLERYREKARYQPIHQLLYDLIHETGYLFYVSSSKGGEQKRANVLMLIEKAKTFDSTSFKGVFHFIQYINQMKKYQVEFGEASIDNEESNTVRIMSIHKSKGLEFPIVFLAGTGSSAGMKKMTKTLVTGSNLGVGIDMVDSEQRMKGKGLIKNTIEREESLEGLGEELRILYVAMTRAKEKLIITGILKEADTALIAMKYLPVWQYLYNKPASYLEILLPVILSQKECPILLSVIAQEEIEALEITANKKQQIRKEDIIRIGKGEHYDENMKKSLEQQIDYQIPGSREIGRKTKISVSELKKLAFEKEIYEEKRPFVKEEHPTVPNFMNEATALKGAKRGTAYHRIMELLDFTMDYKSVGEIKEAISCMKSQEKIDKQTMEAIKAEDIYRFLESPVGRKMREAAKKGSLYRERPFVLGLPRKEVYKEDREDSKELVMIQGIIDVYFELPDKTWAILDYKTDYVSTLSELEERYKTQLDYYGTALQQIMEFTVSKKIIYSFTLGEELSMD